MRSIIDEIATAEEQAEQIRQNAVVQAREQTARAREEAEQALVALLAEEREKTELELGEARQTGERSAQSTISRMEQEADALCARADGKIEQAIAYLMDKATRSA